MANTINPPSTVDSIGEIGGGGLGLFSQSSVLQEQSASPTSIHQPTEYSGFSNDRSRSRERLNDPPLSIAPEGDSESGGLEIHRAETDLPHDHRISEDPGSLRSSKTTPNGSDNISGRSRSIYQSLLSRRARKASDDVHQDPARQSRAATQLSESFADTAVWDRKAILSLDGGGIRGYSALLILRKIMEAIGRLEMTYDVQEGGPAQTSYHPLSPESSLDTEPNIHSEHRARPKTDSSSWLPCHYFDYIAGTSTRGLITIMLGRLGMTIDDCIKEYETLGAKVFGNSRWFHIKSPPFWPRDKYDHEVFEDVVRSVVARRLSKAPDFPGGTNFAFDENRCRVVVVANQKIPIGFDKPYLFRTYENLHISKHKDDRAEDRNPSHGHDVPIWQVARATAAAPTYFKPMVIDNYEYLDGGLGANNPRIEICRDVKIMNNHAGTCIGIVLSIDTGKDNTTSMFKGQGFTRYWNYMHVARKMASDSQRVHSEMLRSQHDWKGEFKYHRLNVETGLDTIKLDEWRVRGRLKVNLGACIGWLRSLSVVGTSSVTATAKPQDNTQNSILSVDNEKPESKNHANTHREPTGLIVNGPVRNYQHSQNSENSDQQVSPCHHRVKGESSDSLVHAASQEQIDNSEKVPQSSSPNENESSNSNVKIPKCLQPRNKTLDIIREQTEAYLRTNEVQTQIEEVAKVLVKGRRDRVRSNLGRWEKACFSAWYQCHKRECPRGEKKYDTRRAFEKHLMDKHRALFEREPEDFQQKLEAKLDAYKVVVR